MHLVFIFKFVKKRFCFKEILESAGGALVPKAEANVLIFEDDNSTSARAALNSGFAVISKDSLVSGLLKYTFETKGFHIICCNA